MTLHVPDHLHRNDRGAAELGFAGLSYDEIADLLGITKRTVTRDWAKAKTWLRLALQEQPVNTTNSPKKDRP